MPRFIKGLDLSRRYFFEVVKPILDTHDKELNYAAGLIGEGSEVLGYDDGMSSDHDWGPSVYIFLLDSDAHLLPTIHEILRHDLPHSFMGYSTNFITAPEDPNVKVMAITTRGAVNHRVHVVTISDYFEAKLNWQPDQVPDVIDWLTFPSQVLRSITSGAVHHDGIGDLTSIRATLAWYPDDVWLYLMAAQWARIGQEEHLMHRAGYVGDDLGASIIASRLVEGFMRLCFLIEKEYAPYPKWFGTAFMHLDSYAEIIPHLLKIQQTQTWENRQDAYSELVTVMLHKHNQLGITEHVSERPRRFHNRPFLVADGEGLASTIRGHITDKNVQVLFQLPDPLGNIDQISDETKLLANPQWRDKLRQLYTP